MLPRVLTLSLLAAASTAALAQTAPLNSVQLYGILDVGVQHTTGYRGGNINALVSGIMEGTRLGFKGSEDLGGGWRALFVLEQRIEADTGQFNNRPFSGSMLPDRVTQAARLGLPAQLQPVVTSVANSIGSTVGVNLNNSGYDRQSYVGLVTPVGAVLLGKQYTLGYELSAQFDTLQTQSALSAGQVASVPSAIDIRAQNAVQYRIVKNGITAAVMAAAGEGSTTTGHLLAAMLMYKSDAFSAGIAYQERENELGQKSLTNVLVGASVKLGPGSLSAEYISVKDDHPSGLSGLRGQLTPVVGAGAAGLVQNAFINGFKQDGKLMHVGYKLELGVNTIYAAYSVFNDSRPANADTSSYGLVYTYALSKRTDINAVAVHFDNRGLGQLAPGQAGFLGGVTRAAGVDSNTYALGVRHRF
ncbi:MAG: porin [Rubrivivax sp.]